jgi:hypothetical protein
VTHTGETVGYHPSKSTAFGHAIRKRGVRQAWQLVQQFYATCADTDEPTSIELRVNRPTEWDDDELVMPHVERALAIFGKPDQERLDMGRAWPTGEPVKGGSHTWHRTAAQLESDLAYLIAAEPFPKASFPTVELNFRQHFRWRHPSTGKPLAHAHPAATTAGGYFGLYFGPRCFIQPTLTFPFVHDDPAFLDFLNAVQPHLPFRMHSNHFRYSKRGKSPGVWHTRKLPWRVIVP